MAEESVLLIENGQGLAYNYTTYIIHSGDYLDVSWNPEFEKYDMKYVHFETKREQYIVRGLRTTYFSWRVPFSGHFHISIAESGTTNWKQGNWWAYAYLKPPGGISFG